MKYIVHRDWPASGGARIIPKGTVIDTDSQAWVFLDGIVPEPTVTPLDGQTHRWLTEAYAPRRGHPGFAIAPVPSAEAETTSST